MRLRSFREFHADTDENATVVEGFARTASATVLITRIMQLSSRIRKTTDPNHKLDLIASQNVDLSALVFAMTQWMAKTKP